MGQLPESTFNLILSALMGALSGFLTIPINAYILWLLKHEEIKFQHKLDMIAKQRELYLQHNLEMQRQKETDRIIKLQQRQLEIQRKDEIEKRLLTLEGYVKRLAERLINE